MGRVNPLTRQERSPGRVLATSPRRPLYCPQHVVESPVMSTSSSPHVPAYRTTLFFGPDVHETNPHIFYCVFNVKKRNWKGGIQLVVEMAQPHVARCKEVLQFESWLQTVLRHLPKEDYHEYFQRGQELFLQHLCQAKLQLALDEGLRRETVLLSQDMFAQELDHAIRQNGDAFKANVFAELDIPPVAE